MSIYAANLLRELVSAGHDVTMISQYYGGQHATVYGGGPPPAVPGVRVIGLEALGEQSGGDFERDIATISGRIHTEHAACPFDILHAQYAYPTGWAALLAGRATRLPVVVSIQGGDGHWVGSCCETHRLAMIRTLDHAGALLIGGQSFAQEVSERLGTAQDRFTIIPGAVDTSRFQPAAHERRQGPVRLLYHGRVDRRKGVLDFVEALARLPQMPAWTATISGIGPDLDTAKELAATRGVNVRFSGYAEYNAAPALYAEHDVFVSPTYSEGFSNTILEAMACGLPVLSCSTVGVVDCVRHGENGLLVASGDIEAQAAQLARLIAEPALRDRLAHAALSEVRQLYSWPAVGRQIMGVYQRLARTAGPDKFDTELPMSDCRFRAQPALL